MVMLVASVEDQVMSADCPGQIVPGDAVIATEAIRTSAEAVGAETGPSPRTMRLTIATNAATLELRRYVCIVMMLV